MAKVKFKNQDSLQEVRNKFRKSICYRQMKDGRIIIIAAKWPSRKNKLKN